MKKYILSLLVVAAFAITSYGQTGMIVKEGLTTETPHPSAVLDVQAASNNKGFLVPRVTSTGSVITPPAEGLLVFVTDGDGNYNEAGEGFWYYTGGAWVPISSSGLTAGNDIDVTGSTVDIEPVLNYVTEITPTFADLILGAGGLERGRILNTVATDASLRIGVSSARTGNIIFANAANANTVTIASGATTPSSYTITLPLAGPTAVGQALLNTGSGVLTWGTVSSTGSTLNSGEFWLGNGSNVATPVQMSGDALMNNAGVVTIQDNAVDGSDLSLTGETTGNVMQFDGTDWVAVAPSASNAWGILGNTNTTSGTNFIGTAAGNNQALDFRTNGVIHARMTTKGQIYQMNTGFSTWIGEGAGDADVPGTNANTFIGYDAGKNTTGAENVFVGKDAGKSSTTGGFRVAVGAGAMNANLTGQYSTAVGYNALGLSTTANNNTAIGYYALNASNTGNNVALGNQAGEDVTGTGNIFIGFQAGEGQTAISNKLYIDNSNTATPLVYGDFNTNQVEINNTLVARGAITTGRTGTDGQLNIFESATGFTYTINPHAAPVQNITLTLPNDYPTASGQVLSSTTGGALSWATPMTNPMNSTGDMIYGVGGTGTPTELNSATGVLHDVAGSAPTWAPVNMAGGATEISGILPVANGGTGLANPTAGSILVGNGTSAVSLLAGTDAQTIRFNGTSPIANSNLLNNGTNIGIGIPVGDFTTTDAILDITGSSTLLGSGDSVALSLRMGDGQNLPSDVSQITFGYSGTKDFRHAIKTRHNSGVGSANAIDFYLWKPGVNAPGSIGTNRVFTIFNNGTNSGIELYGGIYTNTSWGTAGQVLASGGAGVAPTWTNAGTVTSVTGTAPIVVATGTTTPVISLQGAAGTIAYGTGGGSAFSVAGTVAGQILQSNTTGAPTWSTPTYPSASGTAGKILRSDGTNNVYTTSTFADTYPVNTILYAGTVNTVTGLAPVNSSVLTTTAGGVPTWATVASMNADLTVQNGLRLDVPSVYDGSAARTIKLGGVLTEITNIDNTGFAFSVGGAANTDAITIGSSTAAQTLNLSNGSGAGIVNIANAQNAGSVNIGAGMTIGTITIGGTAAQTGTIGIGVGTGAQTINLGTGGTGAKIINVGTGAVANTITIGNVTGATAVNIKAGTGASTFETTGAGTLVIGGAASTGTITVGSSSGAQTLNLGTGGGISTVNIATGAAANLVNINNGASASTIQMGKSNAVTINSSGNVGIGGAGSNTWKLEITGKVKSTGINETSDVRMKKNFASIDGALSKVLQMNGKYYDWRTTEFPNKGLEEGRQVGVIAQEIEKILPEVVATDGEGYKSVEYGHIVPVLIEAIKEQQKIIDGQNSTITDLKASLENVLNRVNSIEKSVDLNNSKVEK